MKQESNILKSEQEISTEIADDIEVVGPGRMLAEAREAIGLSQQQVADKLNFRTTLVQEIEAEQFDLSLPAAFNRGYLKNYAKLVNVAHEDILNSYDQLGVAQRQCAEMQSFSKGTEKQAEHNMLMWVTYLILIALATATVVWWYQAPSVQPTPVSVTSANNVSQQSEGVNQALETLSAPVAGENTELTTLNSQFNADVAKQADASKSNEPETSNTDNQLLTNNELAPVAITEVNQDPAIDTAQSATEQLGATQETNDGTLANLVFTFSGDCWVNIYDATGERVAWGVKKSGYVMRFSGQAPFKVTLGKPELVQIEYNNVAVDMTGFNVGNIAKFSLPLEP